MDNKDGKENCLSYCPNCRKTLTGAVEVVVIETCGIRTIGLEETSDRNWIECDACRLVVCKSCCGNASSGLCNGCLKQLASAPIPCSAIEHQNNLG